jgi:hypothetical protein
MGIGCTPRELAIVSGMIREVIAPDWLILELPDGRFAALWRAGLASEHGAGIAQGDYSGCFAVGTLPEVRAALEPAFLDDEGPSDDLPTRITLPKS